ncbi:MAG: carboxypeptidase regulatory-like domain-containing protein, partial [Planctomycetes bacterium]|nr:carboxypeptidase regulatory-like domain-containing protein [Planctomycetota bacterium]
MRYASIFAILSAFALTALPALAASRDDAWKKVDQAVEKGLPKTAIELLEPIIAGALEDQAYAEAIKAIGRKIALEGEIQGGKPEEKVARMKAEIAKAPEPMRPAMEAILAHWYWQYFQQNRWRFMQRTMTAEAPGEDFTTWDLARILAEIDAQFTKAIAAKDVLRKTPIAEYDALLEKGTMPDRYRPTLYDFLVHEALSFYTAGEQAGARAEDAFDLAADGPIFAPVAEFIAWDLETGGDSATVKAIRLFQDLCRFHRDDADSSAFRDADLGRLVFGYNAAFGEEKAARYKAALRRLADAWADHEISSRVLLHLASVLNDEGEPAEARGIAAQGMNRFPETIGGKQCYNLIQRIDAKEVQISTERVWGRPRPTIDVQYRNVDKVYFRLVAYDWEGRLRAGRQGQWVDDKERQALLAARPNVAWSADLPPTADYRERLERIPAPEDVAPGAYFLLASHDEDFGERDNVVSFTPIWVSDLALVIRQRQGDGVLEGFVLDATSGEPVEGAEVRAWQQERNRWSPIAPVKTDANGIFRFPSANQKNYVVDARLGGQTIATADDYYVYGAARRPRPYTRTIFFTDRSLYRPGQTIDYKGICIRVDQEADAYEAMAGQAVTVVFNDANGKEIERRSHRTNDYGSLSGSFTAPRDRLMGRMSIRVQGEPRGAVAFNVEEYRRPKFQVTIDAPKEAAKLNGPVEVKGKATAYTGAAIDGAKVRYRVVREVRYPPWWGWRYWWRIPVGESQEIARGSATTAVDGSFEIAFVARPDPSVLEKDEPIFRFTIHADVTDTAGETRSADRVVNVGYTALAASLAADDWQVKGKAVEVAVRTETLDGEGQTAEGSVKIFRLKQPESVARPPLAMGRRWWFRRGGADEAPASDPSNPDSWPLGEVVEEKGFTTDAEGKADLSFALEPGAYRAMLTTQDRFGKPVTAQLPIRVLDPEARKLGIKVPDLLEAPAWEIEPGAEFTALWGSGYDRARAYVEIEHRQKILRGFWTEAGVTQAVVRQEVTEAMRGGFTLRVTFVRENRAYLHQQRIEVPWSNKDLTITWERFVSKLEPAQKETWTAIVTGPDAKRAVAEMVATLYDASLDAYLPHGWMHTFGVFRRDDSNLGSSFENQLQQLRRLQGNWPVGHKDAPLTYRSFPQDLIGRIWISRARGFGGGRGGRLFKGAPAEDAVEAASGAPVPEMARAAAAPPGALAAGGEDRKAEGEGGAAGEEPPAPAVDLSQVSARANLNETAFFFPHLVSDKDGTVRIEFTMPEALTEWKFMGFAHDSSLRSGYLEDRAVTSKDLMVQPNPPRFLREGDVLEFTVKVTNQSAARQTGTVRLTLADARTGDAMDAALGNAKTDLAFDIPSKESRSFAWRLTVPDGMGFLTYKAVGSTGRISDGEEGYLPVLSRRIPVTESLPLPIRGPQTKTFDFARLRASGKSDTLRTTSLTVQMVSNPSWYAVMALPYLMEFPHECSEQVFNRLYANALARHIAMSDPKIRRVFDQWRGTPALDSPLEKNQDLKRVMLEETPWVRQAESESQARRNVGVLFEDNRMADEIARAFRKLAEMQREDGKWPWFPGGRGNDYIT